MRTQAKTCSALLLSLVWPALPVKAQQPFEVAGELLINVHVLRGLAAESGGAVTCWTNGGTAGGTFNVDGAAATRPTLGMVSGRPCVSFDGADRLRASFTAPSSITGWKGPGRPEDWSVEYWVYNPSIDVAEFLFTWARRGTLGRYAAVAYGTSPYYGFTSHAGDEGDLGFGEGTGGGQIPAAGVWHHLVVTYDGLQERGYVDGVLNAQKSKTLDIWTGDPVTLGMSYEQPEVTLDYVIPFSGSLIALRVHSGALTAAQVAANFAAGWQAAWWPPPAPTGLVATTGDRSVSLHWNRSGVESPLAGYHIYRSSSRNGPFTALTARPVPLQSYADLLVTNGATYFYRVSALDEMGQASAPSVPVSGTPQAFGGDDALLDYLQQAAFDYFWYEANPLNGLVRERSRSNAVAGVAATGFGLTALGIGIDHGWLSREQGRDRALTTLRALWSNPQGAGATGTIGYNGWFYQSLGFDTALRCGTPELATMDNALLLAGVLYARQYFDGNNGVEAEIRALAEQIFNRVGWGWMTRGSQSLAKGWRPESGFNPTNWVGYSEGLLPYVLGLGAEPGLGSSCWEAWTNGYQWQTNYGYSYLVCPPLAAHQLPQCWLDLRHRADGYLGAKGLTYFENSRRAVLAQRAYAVENPGGWAGYGPWVWGLSASDGPGPAGYRLHGAPPAQNDDGTVCPSAVAGSLPFAPEHALPALRRWYEKFRTELWTGYGFGDGFNLSANWWDGEVVGVDQGLALVLIENYRFGRVWGRCMQSPQIQRGLGRAGFVPVGFVGGPLEVARSPAGWVLEWPAVTGRNYQVEYSPDLERWYPSPTGLVTAGGPTASWVDNGPPATAELPGAVPHRFYRVFKLGPP